MLTKEQIERKQIHVDDDVLKNLHGMKAERKKINLSARKVAKIIGISHSLLYDYETGRYYPSLGHYFLLAKFFGWDTKKSINHIFFDLYTSRGELKKKLEKYALSNRELEKILQRPRSAISDTVNAQKRGSVNVLVDILKILTEEQHLEKFRNELLRQK